MAISINRKYKAIGFDSKKGSDVQRTFTFNQLIAESDDDVIKALQTGKTGDQILDLKVNDTMFAQIGADKNSKAVIKRVE